MYLFGYGPCGCVLVCNYFISLDHFPGGLSEIPPSIATAIAEGNLDPISMEAFACFLGSKCHPGPIRIQTSGHLPRVEPPVVSARESCFVVFSQKARETCNTGKLYSSS